VPERPVVDAIVSSRENSSPFDHGDRARPGAELALVEIGKRKLDLLVGVLRDLLSQNQKGTRIAGARSVRFLTDEFPTLALDLVDPLIDSLELDDDHYYDSADGAACQTLAAIYVRRPEEVQRKLEEGYRRASPEAKAILLDVYEYIASGRGRELHEAEQELNPLYERSVMRIVPFLLGIIGSSEHLIEAREAAARALNPIRRSHADTLIPHLDAFLGTLANLAVEQVALAEEQTEDTLDALDQMTRQTRHNGVVREVAACLEVVTDHRPRAVLDRLRKIVPKLDSKQPHNSRYKSTLTALYGRVGAQREFTPEVIPDLYKLLMDFGSNYVRGAAIKALGEVLQARPEEVPQEMIEVLRLYLGDVYVYIHKSAARVMRYVEPKSVEEATRIALGLLALDEVYEEEPPFRRELLWALMHITQGYEELRGNFAVPILVRYARSSDTHLAEHALEWFGRLLPGLSDEQAMIFTREVVAFLGRTGRERYNDETFSGRYQLLMALHDLPRVCIEKNLSLIQKTARAIAKDDAYDALRLVQLLSRFETHSEAMRLAAEIADAQPRVKRQETIIRQASLSSALEGAEVSLSRGDTETALLLLQDAALLEEVSEEDLAGETRGAVGTFEVAQRIVDRVKGL
jgi:hypothetical protein